MAEFFLLSNLNMRFPELYGTFAFDIFLKIGDIRLLFRESKVARRCPCEPRSCKVVPLHSFDCDVPQIIAYSGNFRGL